MGDVISLADACQDGTLWSVQDMLEDALHDVVEAIDGLGQCNKAVVIGLNDTNGDYSVSFSQAGMSASEMIALVEIFKRQMLSAMGY